ncbi:glycosyltransferase [Desulfovibrio sp. OttesenSCG-928-G15]|nr:glycosyltransferase [Desulfovibrio sp. OttesenSCG-928-G15]
MNYLFLHRRCPGPFAAIAQTLAARPGNTVCFLAEHICQEDASGPAFGRVQTGIVLVPGVGAAVDSMEKEALAHVRRSESFALGMRELHERGFAPDVVCHEADAGVAHFAREIFPHALLVCRAEWFDTPVRPAPLSAPSAPSGPSSAPPVPVSLESLDLSGAAKVRDQYRLSALTACDRAYTASQWQRSRFPQELQARMAVIPDAVDTVRFAPLMMPKLPLCPDEYPHLDRAEEIITYACREFSAVRCFDELCAALAPVLRERPGCHAVLMGADAPCDASPDQAFATWRETVQQKYPLPEGRVHFTGYCPTALYTRLLQASSLHVHLTRPYTLSRSLIEALGTGCLVLASGAPQVLEAVTPGENGLILSQDAQDHPERVYAAIMNALDLAPTRLSLRETARKRALAGRSLRSGLTPLLHLLKP